MMSFSTSSSLPLQINKTSRASCVLPPQKNRERTSGKIFTQAARCSFTRAVAIFTASSPELAVISIITSSVVMASPLKLHRSQPLEVKHRLVLPLTRFVDVLDANTPALGSVMEPVLLLCGLLIHHITPDLCIDIPSPGLEAYSTD